MPMFVSVLVELGVAKECARMVLPLATQTTLYMKGNIRSWLTYLNLRLEQYTQKEHRDIAVEIGLILKNEMPVIVAATNDFNHFNGGFIK